MVERTLGIFGITQNRDEKTVERFLNGYADVNATSIHPNGTLLLLPLNMKHPVLGRHWEKEPFVSIAHAIRRGFDHPRRAFSINLHSKKNGIDGVCICFNASNKLVLGFTIKDGEGEERADALQAGKRLLKTLAADFGCYRGVIGVEQGPPMFEESFTTLRGITIPIYVWDGQESIVT